MKKINPIAAFARCFLPPNGCEKSHPIFSSPHLDAAQKRSVRGLVHILRIFRGALLADPVGSGKTRIGIATALVFLDHPDPHLMVIAPARLREHWQKEARVFDLELSFHSHAWMSREGAQSIAPASNNTIVIVDEAHCFRNPKTKRAAALRALGAHPLLLLSATPFVNSDKDLLHLIGYFLDDSDARRTIGIDPRKSTRAERITLFGALCIRQRPNLSPSLEIEKIEYETSDREAKFLFSFHESLTRLRFEAFKNEWPPSLIRHFLVRQLHCGLAALADSLLSIQRYCEQWLLASELELGMNRTFSKRAFPHGQQPLYFMYPTNLRGIPKFVEEDLQEVASLTKALSRLQSTKERALIDACGRGERVLIFTSRKVVARSLFRLFLKDQCRVGMVHSQRCEVSGMGEMKAEEIVNLFNRSPEIHGKGIDILIATDCLSEGVSFPNCSQLILLDLPDTALKIEQRIGRIMRRNSISKVARVRYLQATEESRSPSFAAFKSDASAGLGFVYPFAQQFLGRQSKGGDPFAMVLDCQELAGTEIESPLLSTHFAYPKGIPFRLTLVALYEGDSLFSYEWVGYLKGRLTRCWDEVGEILFAVEDEDDPRARKIELTAMERNYFSRLVARRNQTRFLPTPIEKDQWREKIQKRVLAFALNSGQRRHVYDVLYSPLTRGQKWVLKRASDVSDAYLLEKVLAINREDITKLTYDIVLQVSFDG